MNSPHRVISAHLGPHANNRPRFSKGSQIRKTVPLRRQRKTNLQITFPVRYINSKGVNQRSGRTHRQLHIYRTHYGNRNTALKRTNGRGPTHEGTINTLNHGRNLSITSQDTGTHFILNPVRIRHHSIMPNARTDTPISHRKPRQYVKGSRTSHQPV